MGFFGFCHAKLPYRLRIVRYHEKMWEEKGKKKKAEKKERRIWLVTTLEEAGYKMLWEMKNCRWDLEENGFYQLKTYYHAKHCYWHEATVVIFNLLIIDFNMRELYLYRRIHIFEGNGMSRKSVSQIFCVNCRQRR